MYAPLIHAVLALALAAATPAGAQPMAVTYSTWLQAGPGADTRVLDELLTGQRVDVQACAGGWCQVVSDRALGYLPQALLAPTPPPPLAPAADGCFAGTHFTPEGPITLKICPGVPR